MSDSTINVKRLARDSRFESRVGAILEVVAMLKNIEDSQHFIHVQAIRANPLDVAVNLWRIHEEAENIARISQKMRRFLYRLYETALKDIYADYQETTDMDQDKKNGHQTVKLKLKKSKLRRPRRMFRRGQRKKEKERDKP